MRKIRKFSVNENGFLLSPEEMRRISGGTTNGECDYGTSCDAYVYSYNPVTGERKLDGHYTGNCDVDKSGNCGCKTSSGHYNGTSTNECIKN